MPAELFIVWNLCVDVSVFSWVCCLIGHLEYLTNKNLMFNTVLKGAVIEYVSGSFLCVFYHKVGIPAQTLLFSSKMLFIL